MTTNGPQIRDLDLAWVEHAACTPDQSDLFFPDLSALSRGTRTRFDRDRREAAVWAPARAICAACPVRPQCLDHAITNDEQAGMWGGLTPRERNAGTTR